MAAAETAEEQRLPWSLGRRLGLILLAGLVASPLSIGPTLLVLYKTGLVTYPLTATVFNSFYAPLHWLEAQSPPIAALIDWYVRLFLEVQQG